MPDLFGRSYSRGELSRRIGRLEQVAGVRLATLGDGGGRGVRVLEFRTGSGLAFDVLVDRSFDIGRCDLRGVPLAWTSAVGVEGRGSRSTRGSGSSAPSTEACSRRVGSSTRSSWRRTPPSSTTTRRSRTESFGLHGRVANRPARLVGYGERWDGDTCTLWAEGETQVAAVFGEQLVLRRRIEAVVGESRLRVHDVVENVGHDLTPHMLLYHVNAGFPVVDEGSELLVAATDVHARGDHPVDGYATMTAPAARLRGAGVRARARGRARRPRARGGRQPARSAWASTRCSTAPSYHHFVWRTLGEGTYVVGLEPCTNRTAGRLDARERGELIELAAGESRSYDLELGALDGADAIDGFAERVRRAVG